MKLPPDSIIAIEKIKNYLLTRRVEDDKSYYIEQAGYTIENWKQLEADIRNQVLVHDAALTEKTKYGDVYEIRGTLTGPNGQELKIVTIWMKEFHTELTKFITLFPDKEK